MRRRSKLVGSAAAIALTLTLLTSANAGAEGTWSWPVQGPVLRPFDAPDSPYGSGHRGIDIGAGWGTPVGATAPGTVSFAGPVGGHLFVTIDHGAGLVSTYSWLSAIVVRKGDAVSEGQVVARSGNGHPGDPVPSLHLGVRLAGVYVDPVDYLRPMAVSDLIRLAPIPSA
jgi:murein DD-endopeptidase MepM/ murein hydrolase activator NlpD